MDPLTRLWRRFQWERSIRLRRLRGRHRRLHNSQLDPSTGGVEVIINSGSGSDWETIDSDAESLVAEAKVIRNEIEKALAPDNSSSDPLPETSVQIIGDYNLPEMASVHTASHVLPPRRLYEHNIPSWSRHIPLSRRTVIIMRQESGPDFREAQTESSSSNSEEDTARFVRNELLVALPSRQLRVSYDIDENERTISLTHRPLGRINRQDRSSSASTTWHEKVYHGLDLDPNSIRLLVLQRGTSQEIRTKLLRVTNTPARYNYEALSYTWGSSEPNQKIFINDVEVDNIQPNLFDALMSLRKADSERILWVDAVCINQKNISEKSWELPKMGEIYRRAKTVLIYLGRPSNISPISTLFDFLSRDNPSLFPTDTTEEQRESEFQHAGVDMLEACEGLIKFTQLDWWTRVWVLQEFYLAWEEPVWHWGDKAVGNLRLKEDLSLLQHSIKDLTRRGSSIQNMLNQPIQTRESPPFSRPPFETEITRISDLISRRWRTHGYDNPRLRYQQLFAGCKEAQDLIYGLTAIFEPAVGKVFVDDYQMDPELLWASLLVFLVRFYDWGDIFWWYPHRLTPQDRRPSWLPDLRRRAIPTEREILPVDEFQEESLPALMFKQGVLYACGIKLGTITSVVKIHADDKFQTIKDVCNYFDQNFNENSLQTQQIVSDATPFGPLPHSSEISHPDIGLLWTSRPREEERRDEAICLPISADAPGWESLTKLTSSMLQDSERMRARLPESLLAVDMNALPIPHADLIVPQFLEIIFETFVLASIFDYDILVGCLVDAAESSWVRYFEVGSVQRQYINELFQEAIKRFLYVFERNQGLSRGRLARYGLIFETIFIQCRDEFEFRHVLNGFAAIATILQKLLHEPVLSCDDLRSSLWETVRGRLCHLKVVAEQFQGRSLFVTDIGFHGLSAPEAQIIEEGDIVSLVDGLSFPMIIRENDTEPHAPKFRMVCCALVRGVQMSKDRKCETAILPRGFTMSTKETFQIH